MTKPAAETYQGQQRRGGQTVHDVQSLQPADASYGAKPLSVTSEPPADTGAGKGATAVSVFMLNLVDWGGAKYLVPVTP